MSRNLVVGSIAVLSLGVLAPAANADSTERHARLPICHGDYARINTLRRPHQFTSLQCRDLSIGSGGAPCQWWNSRPTGTRYIVEPKPPTTTPTPRPRPTPGTSASASLSAAPSTLRLTWDGGTVLPAFRSATCVPSTDELDDSEGAVLGSSAGEGGLVFALAVGTVQHVRPARVIASAAVNACGGTLAVQRNDGGGWVDVTSTAVWSSGDVRSYDLATFVTSGNDVRLVLRSSGTCTVFDGDIRAEFCVPDQSNDGVCL